MIPGANEEVKAMEQPGAEKQPCLFTVGHSNHPLAVFLELLKRHEIRVLVDTRSHPYSRHVPHFNREEIGRALQREGIQKLDSMALPPLTNCRFCIIRGHGVRLLGRLGCSR